MPRQTIGGKIPGLPFSKAVRAGDFVYVSGTVGFKQDDMNIRNIKRCVIITAVPDDDISLFFRCLQDLTVINSSIDHDSLIHQGLVFFSFFNGTLLFFKIRVV